MKASSFGYLVKMYGEFRYLSLYKHENIPLEDPEF